LLIENYRPQQERCIWNRTRGGTYGVGELVGRLLNSAAPTIETEDGCLLLVLRRMIFYYYYYYYYTWRIAKCGRGISRGIAENIIQAFA
jgi:hypothetical protein